MPGRHDADGDEQLGTTRHGRRRLATAAIPDPPRTAAQAAPAARWLSPSRGSPRRRARGSARTEASWWLEALGHRGGRARRRSASEVLQAALGVVGQRVDARDVLLGAGDAHRRAALGQRARAAHGRHRDVLLGRDERDRHQAVGRQAHVQVDASGRRRPRASAMSCERLAPDGEHGVGAPAARRAATRGLLGVGLLGLVAGAGVAEVEVARHAQQLVGADRARPRRGGRARRRSGSCRGRARPWKTIVSASDSARPPTRMATATDASGSIRARRSSSSASSPAVPCCSSIGPSLVPAIRGAKTAPQGYP